MINESHPEQSLILVSVLRAMRSQTILHTPAREHRWCHQSSRCL